MYSVIRDPLVRGFYFLLLGCSVVFPLVVSAQVEYRAGKGQASIEPGDNILSLTLAGYGAPREGRFSLEWKEQGKLGAVTDATIADGMWFTLREGRVWRSDVSAREGAAVELKQAQHVELLAAGKRGLYALNARRELLVASLPTRGALKWKHVDEVKMTPRSLCYWVGRLVVLDASGALWTAQDGPGRLAWSPLAQCKGAIDVMANNNGLYVLTEGQEILKYSSDGNWLRVAVPNGTTYRQDIRLLAVSDSGFWGVDAGGLSYQAQHASTRQLTVGALVVQRGKSLVAILSADVCGFDGDFVSAVKQDIQQAFGIDPSAVLINASHTHFAPATQEWPTWAPHCQKPDSLYLHTVVKAGILAAVRQATKTMQPADLYLGKSEVAIGHNRNLPGDDLPYDQSLDVLRVDYAHDDQDDVVFLAGCHPVFNNAGQEGVTISPNFPGVAREMLVHHSRVRSAMFLQGCGGDINPTDGDHRITAGKLAAAVTDVLDRQQMQRIAGEISFFVDTVHFDSRPWPKDKIEQFRAANEGHEGDVTAEKNVRWADLMLLYYATDRMPATMPVLIQTLNIGNWKLVGVSRETTTEYSLGIKALWPDKLVTVAGYSNDVSSYLPTSKHIKAGIYEGNDSFFWYGQPNIFPENVYETIIESIKTKNR
ncbi:hypothetical protein [Parapedobacter sp. DT-150]|uniref:hypothetical protein n=1 Tax=Parapedobacter sp. DT-150 TaxID=3396162 RepID=UPI003F1CF284